MNCDHLYTTITYSAPKKAAKTSKVGKTRQEELKLAGLFKAWLIFYIFCFLTSSFVPSFLPSLFIRLIHCLHSSLPCFRTCQTHACPPLGFTDGGKSIWQSDVIQCKYVDLARPCKPSESVLLHGISYIITSDTMASENGWLTRQVQNTCFAFVEHPTLSPPLGVGALSHPILSQVTFSVATATLHYGEVTRLVKSHTLKLHISEFCKRNLQFPEHYKYRQNQALQLATNTTWNVQKTLYLQRFHSKIFQPNMSISEPFLTNFHVSTSQKTFFPNMPFTSLYIPSFSRLTSQFWHRWQGKASP